MVGQPESQEAEDLRFVIGISAAQNLGGVSQFLDDGLDLGFGHAAVPGDGAQAELVPGAVGLGLGDPLADRGRAAAFVERGAVLGELAVAVGDLEPGFLDVGHWSLRCLLGVDQIPDGLADAVRGELLGEPAVDAPEDRVLAERDAQRVLNAVGQGVVGGEPAPVVGGLVGPVALHPAVAQAAPHAAAQRVGVPGAVRLVPGGVAHAAVQECLHLVPVLAVDDRRVDDLVGPDPLVRWVPAELGRVAEGDVLDVDQHLVLALLVPDLMAGVPGVAEDRADGELVPRDAAAVGVTLGVVGGRARDAVPGQALGDGVDAAARAELGEDPDHDWHGLGVDVELVQALAVGGLGGVRVRACVHD